MSDTQQGVLGALHEESKAWVSEEPEAAVRNPLILCIFAVLIALLFITVFRHPQDIDSDANQAGRAPASQKNVVPANQTRSAAVNQNVNKHDDKGFNKQTEGVGFAQLASAKHNELIDFPDTARKICVDRGLEWSPPRHAAIVRCIRILAIVRME